MIKNTTGRYDFPCPNCGANHIVDVSKMVTYVAAKDAEIATLKSFVSWLSQRHDHDGLSKGQIIRMAAKLADGGTWQDDHVKYDGRTAVEVLDAEIAKSKEERDYLYDGLNKILHPNGDGPEHPSGCDLLGFLKSDLRNLWQERDALIKVRKAADALVDALSNKCRSCEEACGHCGFRKEVKAYKEARQAPLLGGGE